MALHLAPNVAALYKTALILEGFGSQTPNLTFWKLWIEPAEPDWEPQKSNSYQQNST